MSVRSCDLLDFERPLLARGEIVVGLDEVGRGALAGPMTVGAVVICRDEAPPEGLNDSKLLTRKQREALVEPLRRWASAWSLGSVSAREIDEWGLRLALAVAATRALETLTIAPTHALVDGPFNLLRSRLDVGFGVTRPPELSFAGLPATTIVKGDRRSATIAASAVLAKVARDAIMVSLHEECGEYQWASNKGYGAAEHLAAIRRLGPHAHHRTTWNLPGKTSE